MRFARGSSTGSPSAHPPCPRQHSQGGASRLPLCTPPVPEATPNLLVVRASGVFPPPPCGGVDSKRGVCLFLMNGFSKFARIRKGEHHGSPSAHPPCPRRRPTSLLCEPRGFFRHILVAESIASGSFVLF